MNPLKNQQRQTATQAYEYAAGLLTQNKKTEQEVIEALMQQGLDKANALLIIEDVQKQITEAKKERAKKDMLYGALWCIGGIVATMANIGFIFWGAIIFGAFQFFRGAINAV